MEKKRQKLQFGATEKDVGELESQLDINLRGLGSLKNKVREIRLENKRLEQINNELELETKLVLKQVKECETELRERLAKTATARGSLENYRQHLNMEMDEFNATLQVKRSPPKVPKIITDLSLKFKENYEQLKVDAALLKERLDQLSNGHINGYFCETNN